MLPDNYPYPLPPLSGRREHTRSHVGETTNGSDMSKTLDLLLITLENQRKYKKYIHQLPPVCQGASVHVNRTNRALMSLYIPRPPFD